MIRTLLYLFLLTNISISVSGQNADDVNFTSSNFPIIIINTNGQTIVDDPKIIATMTIIDNGAGMQNSITDPPTSYNGKVGIEIRGSSSQMFPKKQYGIELNDDMGEDVDASLLGMPEESDWVLFAPYNDKTLMRDVLAYKMGGELSQYAPRTRYCELILNGSYAGVYVLIEKIKRDKNRVDINKLDQDEISGDDLTGGYIVKIDKTTGNSGEGWVSSHSPIPNPLDQNILFQYETPEHDEIVEQQRNYIRQYVKEFEDALAGNNFDDPSTGYARYIDVNSFVDYFLVQEITKNVDGYRLSTFFYKQRDSDGGKLVMGPIWDFNIAFGNVDYCSFAPPTGFAFEFNKHCNQDFWLVPFWWHRLFMDENFRNKVVERWIELREKKWKEETIHSYIDSVTTALNEGPQQRNFTKWPVLNRYVWPNFFIGKTFQAEVDWLKDWLSQRLNWLDENLPQLITDAGEGGHPDVDVTVFPNPFSSELTFKYTLRKPGKIALRVFDSMGRVVKEVQRDHDSAGTFVYSWQANNVSGFYYYTIAEGKNILSKGKLSKL